MKIVLFGMGLILATSAHAAKLTFTWDKKEIEALKGKEVYSVYCTPKVGGFTKEVCDRVSKSASFKKFKFKTLEWVDSKTIRVGDGPRSVEILRGSRPGSFSMNGKSFDFGTHTHEQIREKIAAAMPRVGRTSIFMNAAYAEEAGNVVAEINDAIDLMTSQKSEEERCETAQQIALICEDEGSVMPGTDRVISAMKNYTSQKTPSGHARAAKKAFAAIENFRNLIEQSRELISRGWHLQKSCSVEYKGMVLQTEDAFHDCNGRLANFKVDFDQSLNQMVLNDAMARTTHKNIVLKYGEIVKQMETFFNRKMSPYEKQEIIDVLAPVK